MLSGTPHARSPVRNARLKDYSVSLARPELLSGINSSHIGVPVHTRFMSRVAVGYNCL